MLTTLPTAKWRFGADALIQCVVFDTSGKELYTENISGAEATDTLQRDISKLGTKPGPISAIADRRGVYGIKYDSGARYEMWDCDETLYSEYIKENS